MVATVLNVGELWLYYQQLQRIVPVAEGQRCMAVLVWSDAPARITEVLLWLPDGDDDVAADARHTLDTLDLGPVVEAHAGGPRLVVASARSPNEAMVDVFGEIVLDYECRLLAGANRVSGQCGSPGCSNTCREDWTNIQFSSRRARGTTRSRAHSVVPQLVHSRVRFSATMRRAMMCGRTCGLNAAKAALSHHGRYFS